MWLIGTSVAPSELIKPSKTRRSPLPLPGSSGGGDPPSAGLRYQRKTKHDFQQSTSCPSPGGGLLLPKKDTSLQTASQWTYYTVPLAQIVLVRHSPRGTSQFAISPLFSSHLKALKGLDGLRGVLVVSPSWFDFSCLGLPDRPPLTGRGTE